MMLNQFEYELLEPLKEVGINGQFSTVEKLILRAPSKKLNQYTAKLKQGIKQSQVFLQGQVLSAVKDINAFIENANKSDAPSADESDEEKAKKILNDVMSSNVDMHQFEENFKQLCINGCCIIDEKHPLTQLLFEKLSDRDGDNMMGLYLAKFFL